MGFNLRQTAYLGIAGDVNIVQWYGYKFLLLNARRYIFFNVFVG